MHSSANDLAILLIPGSFSPAKFYENIVSGLTQAGYEAVVYDLPSASRKCPEKAATLADDAAFFHEKAAQLANRGKDAILIPHSYGGVVASECVKGLSRAERNATGRLGCVSKIVWLTCVISPAGESLQTLLGNAMPDFITVDGDFMYHEPIASAKVNLSDMSQDTAIELAAQFSHQSTKSFQNKLKHPGYKYIPSAFILCDQDIVLPPDFQRARIDFVERESGNSVRVLHCASGHCPNLSMPENITGLIQEALKD